MNREQTVRGYRIVGDPPKQRELSYRDMQLDHAAHKAYGELRDSVTKNGANCVGKEEFFSGKELPSDRDAVLSCAGCPSFGKCDIFLKVGRPSWGVWASQVRGRGVMEEVEKNW